MGEFLNSVTSVAGDALDAVPSMSSIADAIGDVLGTIASEPIALLMVVGLGVVGFAFGLTRRLIRL